MGSLICKAFSSDKTAQGTFGTPLGVLASSPRLARIDYRGIEGLHTHF